MAKKCYPVVLSDKDKFFTFVERKKEEVVICVGNQIVSALTFKTWQEAKKYTTTKDWELLVNVMCLINKKMNDHEKETSTTTQE